MLLSIPPDALARLNSFRAMSERAQETLGQSELERNIEVGLPGERQEIFRADVGTSE